MATSVRQFYRHTPPRHFCQANADGLPNISIEGRRKFGNGFCNGCNGCNGCQSDGSRKKEEGRRKRRKRRRKKEEGRRKRGKRRRKKEEERRKRGKRRRIESIAFSGGFADGGGGIGVRLFEQYCR